MAARAVRITTRTSPAWTWTPGKSKPAVSLRNRNLTPNRNRVNYDYEGSGIAPRRERTHENKGPYPTGVARRPDDPGDPGVPGRPAGHRLAAALPPGCGVRGGAQRPDLLAGPGYRDGA